MNLSLTPVKLKPPFPESYSTKPAMPLISKPITYQKSFNPSNRFEKHCCGHATRSGFKCFLSDLKEIMKKVNISIPETDEKTVFIIVIDSISSIVNRLLELQEKLKQKPTLEESSSIVTKTDLKLTPEKTLNRQRSESEILTEKKNLRLKNEGKMNGLMKKLINEQAEKQEFREKYLELEYEIECSKIKGMKSEVFRGKEDLRVLNRNNSECNLSQSRGVNDFEYFDKISQKSVVAIKPKLCVSKLEDIIIQNHHEKIHNFKSKLQLLELKECLVSKSEEELKDLATLITEHIKEYNKELELREKIIKNKISENERHEKELAQKMIDLKLTENTLSSAKTEIEGLLEAVPLFSCYLESIERLLVSITRKKKELNFLQEKTEILYEKIREKHEKISRFTENPKNGEGVIEVKNIESFPEYSEEQTKALFLSKEYENLKILSEELEKKLKTLLSKEKELDETRKKLKREEDENEKTLNFLKILKQETEKNKLVQEDYFKKKKAKFDLKKEQLSQKI